MPLSSENVPTWATRIILGILGAILLAAMTVTMSDRDVLAGHETRIAVLERRANDTENLLGRIDTKLDRIIDCQRRQEQGRECE